MAVVGEQTIKLRLDSADFIRDVKQAKRRMSRPDTPMRWVQGVLGIALIVVAVLLGPLGHEWSHAVFDLVLGIWLIERAES